MAVIYALLCPETHICRYVGYDKSDNQARYKAHCRQSNNYKNTPRCNWLTSLLRKSQKPDYLVLETNPEDWERAEVSWIKYYKFYSGKLLTNVAEGGLRSNEHMQASPKSNRSTKTRSKLSQHLSDWKMAVNKGWLSQEKYNLVCEKIRQVKKRGLYDQMVEIYELGTR